MKRLVAKGVFVTHQTCCLAKDRREGVNELYNRAHAFDELPILAPIIFERFQVFLK